MYTVLHSTGHRRAERGALDRVAQAKKLRIGKESICTGNTASYEAGTGN